MKAHLLLLLVLGFAVGSCTNKHVAVPPTPTTPSKPEPITPQNVSFRAFQVLAHSPVNVIFSPIVLKNTLSLFYPELVDAKKEKLEQIFGVPSEASKSSLYTLDHSIITQKNNTAISYTLTLQGSFSTPFDPKETILTHFQSSPYESNTVKVMHRTGAYPYFENQSAQWIELDFKDSPLQLWIGIPKKGTDLSAIAEKINSDYLSALQKGFKKSKVEVVLPKFSLNEKLSTKDVLGFSGVDFTYNKASFNKNSKFSKYNFSEISQVVNLSVGELGINENTADSKDQKEDSIFSLLPKRFYATQPFLFILKNSNPDEILLLGRVYRP